MDAADFEFVRIPEFDVKELKLLFETDLQVQMFHVAVCVPSLN
jgi:hypothetical protein